MTQPGMDPDNPTRNFLSEPPSPDEVNAIHRYSDKDSSVDAQHHSLGLAPEQASFGDHSHDGRNSKILSGLSVSTHTHTASLVEVTPTGLVASTNVQDAISELDNEKATVGHTHANPAASAVTFTPTGLVFATDVQAAIAEVDAEKAAIGHTHTAQTATQTPFTPVGLIAATNVQTALAEVDNEKQTKFAAAISVTGSRGGNVALASLLTALATHGLIVDNTVV